MVIPSRINTAIALDTSALSNVLASDAAVDQFAATVLRRPVTVFVSTNVIVEISSDGDQERAFRMLQRFRRLCRKLGARFCPAPGDQDLMKGELRERLRGPPAYSEGWTSLEKASSAKLLAVAKGLPESYEWLRRKKADLFEKDRGLHQFMAARGVKTAPDEIIELICATNPPREDDMIIELAAEMSEGEVAAAKIVSDPRRFKATHVLSHLVWRLCLANSVDRQATTKAQENVLGMWRTKKKGRGEGTWHDIAIAAAAAYVDLFISDDRDQLNRCSFLRDRNLVTFRPITLAEFLE